MAEHSPACSPAATAVDLGEGQEQYYEFDVPYGVRDITADVSLTNDAGDPVGSYLVSPDGDTLGYGQNALNGTSGTSLSAYTLNPVPGRWTLIVAFGEPIVGDEVSQRYTGDIRFDAVRVSAHGVPDGFGSEADGRNPGDGPGDRHQHRRGAGGLLRRSAPERHRGTDAGTAVRGNRHGRAADA